MIIVLFKMAVIVAQSTECRRIFIDRRIELPDDNDAARGRQRCAFIRQWRITAGGAFLFDGFTVNSSTFSRRYVDYARY